MKYEWVPWLINTCMLIATLFVGFTAHRWRKERASKQELEDLKTKIEEVDKKSSKDRNSIHERLSHIEGSLQHLPTAVQLADFIEKAAKTNGDVAALNARFESQGIILKSIAKNVSMLTENELAKSRQNK